MTLPPNDRAPVRGGSNPYLGRDRRVAADEADRLSGPPLGRLWGGRRLDLGVGQGAGVKIAVTLGEKMELVPPLMLLQTR